MSVLRSGLGRAAQPVLGALARAGGGAPPGLRRGDGAEPADVPVVVVHLCPGAEEVPDAVLGPVTAARRRRESFTPVLLLERPLLAPYRRAGYVVELVAPPGVEASLAEVVRTYAAAAVVRVAAADLDDAASLEARLLEAVPEVRTGPVAGLRSLVRRLEGSLR